MRLTLLYAPPQHPTPSTPQPSPYTLTPSPKPRTLHPTPNTPHLTPYTQHPTPYTLYPKPCTLHPARRIANCMSHNLLHNLNLNPKPQTLDFGPWTLDPRDPVFSVSISLFFSPFPSSISLLLLLSSFFLSVLYLPLYLEVVLQVDQEGALSSEEETP